MPFLTTLVVIIADQFSKVWAVHFLADKGSYQVLGQFFQIRLVLNEGGALGTNFGSGTFYLISSILILIIVIYLILTNRENYRMTIPMGLIAGGALGNIIDRLRTGQVIDFLDFDFFDFSLFGRQIERWWIFNIADAAITAAVIFLIIFVILFPGKKSSPRPEPDNHAKL
nr:signal peptidase II [candidate division Zixibacteria bacterium]